MLPNQSIQIDEVGIARVGRAGLVRGVPVTCGTQRQHLPGLLTGLVQEVQERVGTFAHGTHAVGSGQRCDMHENTGFAHF